MKFRVTEVVVRTGYEPSSLAGDQRVPFEYQWQPISRRKVTLNSFGYPHKNEIILHFIEPAGAKFVHGAEFEVEFKDIVK